MTDDVLIVEEMALVVEKVDKAMQLGRTIQYMYGHPLEIVTRLQAMTNSPTLKNQKYPLIVLFTDISIRHDIPGYYGSAKLQMIVATTTVQEYSAEQRTANNFKPTLHPIKRELIRQISRHTQFTFPDETDYEEIDRYYWGKAGLYGNTGNIFNDYIDCIELKDIRVNIKNKFC